MAGHIAGGVSTAYYADEHIFDEIKGAESFTVSEEFARLRDSMATAAVSNCIRVHNSGPNSY